MKDWKSKTNWAHALYFGAIAMIGSWDFAQVFWTKFATPEAVAFGGLVIAVIMRRVTNMPLSEK